MHPTEAFRVGQYVEEVTGGFEPPYKALQASA